MELPELQVLLVKVARVQITKWAAGVAVEDTLVAVEAAVVWPLAAVQVMLEVFQVQH
jgi:hypothetical protein